MNVVYNDVNRCSLDLGHLPENSVSPHLLFTFGILECGQDMAIPGPQSSRCS